MEELAKKLLRFCECIKKATAEDVAELVNLISLATGWVRVPCETFIMSDRTEIIDLPSCSDCPIEFEPYYRPFRENTFKFELIKISGVNEEVTEITDFGYHESEGKFYLNAVPKCECKVCTCGCEPKYKLKATYEAGYTDETLPECMFPVLCDVLSLIVAKNDCDCRDCGCGGDEKGEYTEGDLITEALEVDLGKMLLTNYKTQLGYISIVRPTYFLGMTV